MSLSESFPGFLLPFSSRGFLWQAMEGMALIISEPTWCASHRGTAQQHILLMNTLPVVPTQDSAVAILTLGKREDTHHSACDPSGPVELGSHWAAAFLDERHRKGCHLLNCHPQFLQHPASPWRSSLVRTDLA